VGRGRLSDTFGKAKKAFKEKKKIPKWISESHWNDLLKYWDTEEFNNISNINSRNRKSGFNGEGPSLHTGGSVAFSEYKKRHVSVCIYVSIKHFLIQFTCNFEI